MGRQAAFPGRHCPHPVIPCSFKSQWGDPRYCPLNTSKFSLLLQFFLEAPTSPSRFHFLTRQHITPTHTTCYWSSILCLIGRQINYGSWALPLPIQLCVPGRRTRHLHTTRTKVAESELEDAQRGNASAPSPQTPRAHNPHHGADGTQIHTAAWRGRKQWAPWNARPQELQTASHGTHYSPAPAPPQLSSQGSSDSTLHPRAPRPSQVLSHVRPP